MEEKHNSPATTTESAPPSSSEPQSSRRRGGGMKRKASNLSNSNTSTPPHLSSSKRQSREKPSPVLFPPIHNGPLTRARLQPNYAESSTFWDAVDVNDEVEVPVLATPVAAKVEEDNARREAWEALEAKIEAEYERIKSRDANVHVVPISSGWFSWTKVHPLEEKALPSFFNGKLENRSREIYMEIRNSIMKKFHANPDTQIELKDLSEILVGELDAKKEVMEFLDYWGLINYHPLPEADIDNSVGDVEEAAKVKSLIQKLYEFDVDQLFSPAVPRSSIATPAVPFRVPESIVVDDSAQPEGPSVEYHCNSCAADCSRKRYHCQKQADFDLCTECFNEGKFGSDMSPSDFILMEPGDAAGASSEKWTDQETLLLLEALELFNENWSEIAEHVATKTKAQCILHFVQMPIEDTFRDCDDEDNDEKKDKNLYESDEKKEVGQSHQEKDEKMEIDQENGDSQDMKGTEDPKANNDEPGSCLMDITESVDNNNNKSKDINQENGVNIAVKALREAFDAVGSLSSPDEKLCFADAGNPVMAMAAFLTRLVEPNIVAASARTSLKSLSGGGTGLLLSARHSFVLEDPTDGTKTPDDTDRDVQEVVEQEVLKENIGSCNKQEEEKESTKVTENEDERETEKELLSDETKEDTVTAEVKKECTKVTENEDKREKQLVSDKTKEDTVTAEVNVSKIGSNIDTRRKGVSKKDNDLVTEKPVIVEETNKQIDKVENTSNSEKETEETNKQTDKVEDTSNLKKEDEETNKQTDKVEDTMNSKKETEDSGDGGLLLGLVDSQSTEIPKDEEMVEKTEPTLSILAENTPNSGVLGGTEAKDSQIANKDLPDTKDDPHMHKLTHAAVTAITAAAVKAKFLADQEEDHIRQLATSLVEKQLHKLETKLTFFTEMDGLVSRAREQLERSKQRLYQERAQIIAARLGMSGAASSRPMPHMLQRPPNPMSMTPQRPPLSRPMMGPTPIPNPAGPTTVAGNSSPISNNQAMK
ncbi:hypothetical protein SSX86_029995 [Deinandra increscens subsp. villosa]|uniref:SWI/SNF complex subunit SWI3D n=1 Tax=Deinandra increscens subsp. villosa TaxID=3103831 RepID=A0AAP0CGR0_9ASTR